VAGAGGGAGAGRPGRLRGPEAGPRGPVRVTFLIRESPFGTTWGARSPPTRAAWSAGRSRRGTGRANAGAGAEGASPARRAGRCEREGSCMPSGRRPYGAPLSEGQVLAWAEAHFARTGRWPHHDSGPVEGVPGQTWAAIDDEALRRGHRGLPGGRLAGPAAGPAARRPLAGPGPLEARRGRAGPHLAPGRSIPPDRPERAGGVPAAEAARHRPRARPAGPTRRRAECAKGARW
jgi:hypothetical protein